MAKLACDIGGPYERAGWKVERLLRHAGWTDPPEYDGSSRVHWLIEEMQERREIHADIERLLCRLCDPMEYDDGVEAATVVQIELNRILEPERLIVSTAAGRPVLADLNALQLVPVFSAPSDLDRRLPPLIADEAMVTILLGRIAEVHACEAGKAYLLAVVGIGSFVEGLLFSVLTERDPVLLKDGFPGFAGQKGKTPAHRASLALLLSAAHKKGWIQIDAKEFMEKVREFRNYVHPRQQLESKFSPDEYTLGMCWGPVRAILNDLEVALVAGAG
ncbi:hypothetical protein MXD61_11855 [Frankia sp. AgPm24]|uniref:hypothetical protein n=1 Tax=Frankia sp. AgPm24 TaxID=631128 RepID=UPI00200BC75B|nr:hypothetical protein [Frankia sp. AgPm24]MCK9922562.1 hypothetical protein [Frankia sp. AgPm24]